MHRIWYLNRLVPNCVGEYMLLHDMLPYCYDIGNSKSIRRKQSTYPIMSIPWLLMLWLQRSPCFSGHCIDLVLRNIPGPGYIGSASNLPVFSFAKTLLTYIRGDDLQTKHKHNDHPFQFHKTPTHSLSVSLKEIKWSWYQYLLILLMLTCFRLEKQDYTNVAPNANFLQCDSISDKYQWSKIPFLNVLWLIERWRRRARLMRNWKD